MCIRDRLGGILYFLFPSLRYTVYGFGHMGFRFSTLWIAALLLVLGLLGLQRALQSGWWRPGIAIGVTAIIVAMLAAGILAAGPLNFEHVLRVASFTLLYASLMFLITSAGDRPG